MTREQLQQIFESEFDWNNWKKVMNFVFPEFKFNLVQTDLTRDTQAHKKSAGYIKEHGTTQLASPEMLTLCEILVTDKVRLDRNIKSVRSLVADLAVPNYQTVIAVFHNNEPKKWRFTLVVKEFTGSNKVYDKKPDSYTYVFGLGEKGRTASERFFKLAQKSNKTLKDLEEAFSVEALSKKFFKEYKDIYQQFVEDIVSNPSRLALFKENSKEKQEKSARDFVKKMMGRLVFLYFLQKKDWLGCKTKWKEGDEAFMKTFVTKARQDDSFYFQYLEPLFFDTLNEKRTKQDEDCIIQKTNFGKVPYLNGGLFEKDDNHPKGLTLKWEIFQSLFDTLNNYNFTIIEDDPEFKEVAVDPEMLGHIFENLLEDNKDKGAYYTPKEIVHYMCQESLYEYLKTYLQQNKHWPEAETGALQVEKSLQRFVKQKLASGVIDYDKPLAKALRDVKICDPAIGSGAFPMGLLNEIYHCVHKLHDESPDKVGDVWGIGKVWQGNKVKLNIIQNSIYGVDIEKGAVDIARLRFWLSLIVDEPQPTPLPNLDYKIVVGNSLVSKLGSDVVEIDWNANETTHGLFGAELAEKKKILLKKISEEQKQSFDAGSDKPKLTEDIRNLKIDLLITQLELMIKLANQDAEPKVTSFKDKNAFTKATDNYHKVLVWKAHAKRLKGIKQKKGERLNFFDWKLDFPEVMNDQLQDTPGFNIVIANPPYIGERGNKEQFLDVREGYLKDFYLRKMDLFYFFFHNAINLAKKNATITIISTNYYLTADGAFKLRKDLKARTSILKLINFNEYKIFESAKGQHNMITIATTSKSTTLCWSVITKERGNFDPKIINSILNGSNSETEYKFVGNSSLYDGEQLYIRQSGSGLELRDDSKSQLLEKIKSAGLKLDTLFKVSQGVLTGIDRISKRHIESNLVDSSLSNHGVFVIKQNELESMNLTNVELGIVKPFFKNSDIDRYIVNENEKFKLIYATRDLNIDLYPNIKKHFLLFEKAIKNRSQDRGEMQAAMKLGKWWVIFAAREKEVFEKEKIVCPQRSYLNTFGYTDKKWYGSADVYFITSNTNKHSLKDLLGLLNSKLMYFWLYNRGKRKGDMLEIFYTPLTELPILIPNSKQYTSLVDEILIKKRKGINTTELERKVDTIIYKTYSVAYNEVKIIDPDYEISEYEYNSN